MLSQAISSQEPMQCMMCPADAVDAIVEIRVRRFSQWENAGPR